MKKFIFTLFCFCTVFVLAEKKEIIYKQTIGKEKSEQKWIKEENEKDLKLICHENEEITTIEFSKNYQMNKYHFKSKKDEYFFDLKGKTIVAKGVIKGKKIDTKIKIKTPWVQQFSFALKPFLISKKRSMEFSLINPKNFSLQKMVVKKKEIGNLSIEGKNYQAQKIIVKLAGFKGAFWEAELWYEKSSGDFLKYKANSGPNTPLTTIWLSEKK